MKIGIDLDNTIISYESAFLIVGKELGFLPQEWSGSKVQVREYLRKRVDGENLWQRLQGQVYGSYVDMAELFPGVFRFIWRCKRRNISVDIISHKTEYGHYDENRVSLRAAATSFLVKKGLYGAAGESLVRSVAFFDSKEAKIDRISEGGYTSFIDDLPEILRASPLSGVPTKILFDPNAKSAIEIDDGLQKVPTWYEIEERLLGPCDEEDLMEFAKEFRLPAVRKAYWISGQGNSRVAYLETEERERFALKLYPMDANHDRLTSEYAGLELMHKHGIDNTPTPIKRLDHLNCALYSWIEGEKIPNIGPDDVEAMLSIMNKLSRIKGSSYDVLGRASAACFSGLDIERQLQRRLDLLYSSASSHAHLQDFLDNDFIPFKTRLVTWVQRNWPQPYIYDQALPREELVLSPSDFGSHNMLKAPNGKRFFLDFEYFGWDDPAKLIADVALHPGVDLNGEWRLKWEHGMFTIFGEKARERYVVSRPIYALCWCLILLNEFRNDVWLRRISANRSKSDQRARILEQQLQKSKRMLDSIRKDYAEI